MSEPESPTISLVVAAGSRACAVALSHAVETMRPLPIEALAGSPPFVSGLSIIRGRPVPVVHLGRLIGAGDADAISRFVTLRLEDRRLALAVSAVLGVREIDPRSLGEWPPLLGPESGDIAEAVGRLDGRVLVVLRAMRVVPRAVWDVVSQRDASQ